MGDYPFRYKPPEGSLRVERWSRLCRQYVYAQSNSQVCYFLRSLTAQTLGKLIAIDGSACVNIQGNTWWTYSDRGFPSVGICGIIVNSGKWYYELEVISPGGVAQVGWCDLAFRPELSDSWGVGDDRHRFVSFFLYLSSPAGRLTVQREGVSGMRRIVDTTVQRHSIFLISPKVRSGIQEIL